MKLLGGCMGSKTSACEQFYKVQPNICCVCPHYHPLYLLGPLLASIGPAPLSSQRCRLFQNL